jgi:two-component system, cell cycle sensor histidine kinase and response regulator CckA
MRSARCGAERAWQNEIARADLKITLRDNGPGISPDVLPRIFEPLFTTKNFGVGLGLPTIRQIVELHGGTIAESRPNEGAIFTIWLPRGAAPAAAPAPVKSQAA